jgi:sRNA-binding protein
MKKRKKMAYRFTRQDSEAIIRILVEKYPKCFFDDPKKRRPLKNNIIADLQQEGFPVASDAIVAAIDWYQSHFGYQYALQAGVKRIDLNGKEAGTVTEKEQNNAQKKIRDDHQKLSERNLNSPGRTMAPLYNAGRISEDQLKKLDAPMKTKATTPAIAPQLERRYEAFMAANAALLGSGDAVLRSAMAAAALEFMVKEAQRVIKNSAEEIGDERLSGR